MPYGRKFSTTIYLEPDQHDSLKKISKVTCIPMAALIREAVDRVISTRSGKGTKELRDGRGTKR